MEVLQIEHLLFKELVEKYFHKIQHVLHTLPEAIYLHFSLSFDWNSKAIHPKKNPKKHKTTKNNQKHTNKKTTTTKIDESLKKLCADLAFATSLQKFSYEMFFFFFCSYFTQSWILHVVYLTIAITRLRVSIRCQVSVRSRIQSGSSPLGCITGGTKSTHLLKDCYP